MAILRPFFQARTFDRPRFSAFSRFRFAAGAE
jgi:hypothetical protein